MSESKLFFEEIIKTINKIEQSVLNMTIEDFSNDLNLFDATLMRLHVIGENVKSIPFDLKKKHKKIRWNKFARLRNIIGHKYSSVNKEIIWDVIKRALPEFKKDILKVLEEDSN